MERIGGLYARGDGKEERDDPRDDGGVQDERPAQPFTLDRPELLASGAQFILHAYTNRNWVIEASADAQSWAPIETRFQFVPAAVVLDSSATNASVRVYRARLAP